MYVGSAQLRATKCPTAQQVTRMSADPTTIIAALVIVLIGKGE
jgi:hypothetical protein